MKFRKKPVVIEAMQFDGSNAEVLVEAFQFSASLMRSVEGSSDPLLTVATLEGNMVVSIGDWVIRGVKGELYPCKPDIFEATYEAAE